QSPPDDRLQSLTAVDVLKAMDRKDRQLTCFAYAALMSIAQCKPEGVNYCVPAGIDYPHPAKARHYLLRPGIWTIGYVRHPENDPPDHFFWKWRCDISGSQSALDMGDSRL